MPAPPRGALDQHVALRGPNGSTAGALATTAGSMRASFSARERPSAAALCADVVGTADEQARRQEFLVSLG